MDGLTALTTVLTANTLGEPIRNLLNPIMKEMGEFGGDVGKLMRHCGNVALSSVFGKLYRQRGNKPLSLEEFKRIRPLLLLASYQDEDELQERWAALLDSVMSYPDDVLPSFGQTLSQLTTDEALFLGRISASSMGSPGRQVSLMKLQGIYDPELESVPYAELQRLEGKLKHASLLVQDLERLGILNREQRAAHIMDLGYQENTKLKTTYSLSDYGRRFIEAVTPKTPSVAD